MTRPSAKSARLIASEARRDVEEWLVWFTQKPDWVHAVSVWLAGCAGAYALALVVLRQQGVI